MFTASEALALMDTFKKKSQTWSVNRIDWRSPLTDHQNQVLVHLVDLVSRCGTLLPGTSCRKAYQVDQRAAW